MRHAALLRAWRERGDIKARNAVCEDMRAMVYQAAHRAAARYEQSPPPGALSRVTADEIEGYMWEWVFRSADLYDQEQGASWVTYCYNRLRAGIARYHRKQARLILIPDYIYFRHNVSADNLPTVAAADAPNSTGEGTLADAYGMNHRAGLSGAPDSSWEAGDGVDAIAILRDLLRRAPLNHRERRVLPALLGKQTLRAVAAEMGVSYQRVSQLCHSARKKLRAAYEELTCENKGENAAFVAGKDYVYATPS